MSVVYTNGNKAWGGGVAMHNDIRAVRHLEKTARLKVGDEVLLVRGEGYEPEVFVVTIIYPAQSPPVGESLETGLTRVLVPTNQNERFFIIERAA
jgi:hypothetical protein